VRALSAEIGERLDDSWTYEVRATHGCARCWPSLSRVSMTR